MADSAGRSSSRCVSKPTTSGVSISLPVIDAPADARNRDPKRTIKKSKMGPRRAAVLIGVHIIMIAHLVLWYVSGMRDGVRETLAPVEPSESMYTLENGVVNAGFIFFVLAILSTFVFGRFFCGWGCHIVAVQDFCGWIMKKCGVHPKPFRSRLLMWVPLILALYMFVWPTFKREVLYKRVIGPEAWVQQKYDVWFGEQANFPGWSNGLQVEDFWKTFASWYMAIPFIGFCGFAIVYFLGSKAFCTYGCPYGGFFAPVDKIALGRIRVTDSCEGCGHCTAVCSSNVRVHEEVRDYGMVVDPGCMKCLDCVDVCPNDALYFGIGAPALGLKPKSEPRKRVYDLSLWEELFVAAVFYLLVQGFRGFFNSVPLLMAIAMAAIGAFGAWKLVTLVRDPHSRLQNLQLKYKGRIKPAGWVFGLFAVVMIVAGVWGAAVQYARWWSTIVASRIATPLEVVLAPTYKPEGSSKEVAAKAIKGFDASDSFANGGWGWKQKPDDLLTVAYLRLVVGDRAGAEKTLMEIMERGNPRDDLVRQLGTIMSLRGASEDDIIARYEQILQWQPSLHSIRAAIAKRYAKAGKFPQLNSMYEEAIARLPGDPSVRKDYGMLLVQLAGQDAGQREKGLQLMREATEIATGKPGMEVRRNPDALRQIGLAYLAIDQPATAVEVLKACAELPSKKRPMGATFDLARAYFFNNQRNLAVKTMQDAIAEEPLNPVPPMHLAQMYDAMGQPLEAQKWAKKSQELQNRQQQPGPTR